MEDLITLHPKFVHFPIALIFVAAFFEFLFVINKKEFFGRVSVWLFYLGLLAAFVAAATGAIAANNLGHKAPHHDLIHVHRNWMLVTLTLWLITGLVGFVIRKKQTFRKFFIVALVFIMGVLLVGVDKGGDLVYEHGVGINKKIIKEQPHKDSGHSPEDEKHHNDGDN